MMRKLLYLIFRPKALYHRIMQKISGTYADRIAIKEMWKANMDYDLNIDNPQTFNEKLQWLKLYDRNPQYTILADKYKIKEWIETNIGKQYVIPLLGVYHHFDEINFDKLPNQFVLKCNHDCGSVIICKDKNTFDRVSAKQKLEEHLKIDFFIPYREWCYKNIPRRIICEKYMQDEKDSELTDYKFFCFNGVPRFLYVSYNLSNWNEAFISYMNLDWTPAPFHRPDFQEFKEIPPKPSKFEEMIELAKQIAKDFIFVRVDLFQINNQVYLSELTFYPGAGIDKYTPEGWDRKIGDLLQLPSKKRIYRNKK